MRPAVQTLPTALLPQSSLFSLSPFPFLARTSYELVGTRPQHRNGCRGHTGFLLVLSLRAFRGRTEAPLILCIRLSNSGEAGDANYPNLQTTSDDFAKIALRVSFVFGCSGPL